MKTDAIKKIIEIADKIYLGEDFSQDDYKFFVKYMCQCFPHWFHGNREDVLMDLFLQIKDNYDINGTVGRKYRYLENYILLICRDEEVDMKRLCMGIYNVDYDEYVRIPDGTDLELDYDTKILADIIMDTIKKISVSFDETELIILNKCILSNDTLVSVANECGITSERVRVIKERIIKKIKNCVEIRLKNDINI